MTYNTGDSKSIKRAEKAAKQAELERREVIVELVSTPAGRRYVMEKLASAHMFHTSYSDIPSQMAFNEGERNQGLMLLNDFMQYCPEQFIQAMREANERRDASNGLRNTAAATERSSGEDTGGDDQGPASEPASGDTGAEEGLNGYSIG